MNSVWIANLLTGALPMGIIIWLLQDFVKTVKKSIVNATEKAEQALTKSSEIEVNYIERFLDVNNSINNSVVRVTENMTNSIKEVELEKNNYRLKQMGEIHDLKSKIDILTKTCENYFKNSISE